MHWKDIKINLLGVYDTMIKSFLWPNRQKMMPAHKLQKNDVIFY